MTILEKFVAFAERLPAARRDEIEAALTALMDCYTREFEFTSAELEELDHRVAEPRPRFASSEEIDRLMQRSKHS